MGTRADFYVGRGEQAEWLGSIASDGYPDGIPIDIARPVDAAPLTEAEFRGAVDRFLSEREDATRPDMGWPWPWDTSHTTDYTYAWESGDVYVCCFGSRWYRSGDSKVHEDEDAPGKDAVFPDMTARKNITYGPRSGLVIVTTK